MTGLKAKVRFVPNVVNRQYQAREAMKVKQLTEALQTVPDDYDVIVRSAFGWLGGDSASFTLSAQNPGDGLEIDVYKIQSDSDGYFQTLLGQGTTRVENK